MKSHNRHGWRHRTQRLLAQVKTRSQSGFRACTWALIALLALAQTSLACTVPTELKTDLPPGGTEQPTDVTVSFSIIDFMNVDDENQRIELDMFLQMSWTDPRLAQLSGCRVPITAVWFPRIRLLNSDQFRVAYRNSRNQVAIGDNGTVSYTQRFTGAVSSYHTLTRFPFDSHIFSIDFVNLQERGNWIEFTADSENTWIADRLNIEGWSIGDVSLSVSEMTLQRTEMNFEKLSLKIEAKRNPEFYIYRLITLLTLVVAMSWVIFWVPPSQFEFQIGIGATTMLTAMAFVFAISNQLPPVGYLTVLDKMVIWAIILIFMSIVEALIAGRLVLANKEEQARRLDWVSRFCFPILLFSGWTIVISAT